MTAFPLIERVRRLAENATKGPWIASGVVTHNNDIGRLAVVLAQFPSPIGEAALCLIPMGRSDREYLGAVADKNFIAAMRTDAPALADVAEQALKALIFIGSKRGCLFAECADAESIIAAVDKVLGMAKKE